MVPGVILAAGASSRMGRPKALLPTASPGETFVVRLANALRTAGVADVLLVAGREAGAIRQLFAGLPLPPRVIENPHVERGQLSSLLAALQVVDRPGVHAMLVALVDCPLVAPETVRALLEAHARTRAPVVRPARGGRHGHPVIFDRTVFDELRQADPAQGAKAVVWRYRGAVLDVPVTDARAFEDIDTPEDYERAFGRPLPG